MAGVFKEPEDIRQNVQEYYNIHWKSDHRMEDLIKADILLREYVAADLRPLISTLRNLRPQLVEHPSTADRLSALILHRFKLTAPGQGLSNLHDFSNEQAAVASRLADLAKNMSETLKAESVVREKLRSKLGRAWQEWDKDCQRHKKVDWWVTSWDVATVVGDAPYCTAMEPGDLATYLNDAKDWMARAEDIARRATDKYAALSSAYFSISAHLERAEKSPLVRLHFLQEADYILSMILERLQMTESILSSAMAVGVTRKIGPVAGK